MSECRAFPFIPLTLTAGALALLAACAGTEVTRNASADVAADAVYFDAKVLTVDGKSSVAQAFAVKGGKFLAVGSDKQVMALAGPSTQVVDLHGRTVIPGLTDSHMHAPGGGPGMDLSQARSLADVYAVLSAAARDAKPGTVLVSNGDWHEAQFKEQRLPSAAELEKAAPGVPVVLVRGGHSYFLNESALAKYGITPATQVPRGGAVPRDASGKLTGEVTDAAKALVQLPPMAPADLVAQQKILNSYGLTSVRVPGVSVPVYHQIQKLAADGLATVRYSVLIRPKNLADFQSSVVGTGIKQGEGNEWVRLWGIKISSDGGFEGGFMTKPYEEPMGQGGKYRGLQLFTQEQFNDYVAGLNRAGFRAAVHAVGDAALDEVLTGYEKANAQKDITHSGWAVEHAFIVRPDQLPRMKALNLRLSVQDHLYLAAPIMKKYWGADRAEQVTPLKTFLDLGFEPAGGTDSPVIPLSPFWVMYHFMTRDTISDGVYGPAQAVTSRDEILRIMTINNAKLTDEEKVKGSIETGKFADFVVLSADFMTIPVAQVQNLKALATYVGGKQVYLAPGINI